jgi:2'-5' RNA ligase
VNRTHRLFFALVPDPAVRERIEAVQRSLPVAGRATPPHQFHATLAFLGMQPPACIPAIFEAAGEQEPPGGRVRIDRVGVFRRTGVLWLGASRVPEALARFQANLVGSLLDREIGYDRKPWEFHVTLYRKLRKPAPIMESVAIEWAIDGFDLVESVRVGNGVEYHSIGHWK